MDARHVENRIAVTSAKNFLAVEHPAIERFRLRAKPIASK
jgi:hypothetical protein